MSINMRVMAVSDADIASFTADPTKLDLPSIVVEAAELNEHWREIDYILGGQSFLLAGDAMVRQSRSEPAHVIHASKVPSLATTVGSLSESQIRNRLDPVAMRAAGLWVPDSARYIDNIVPTIVTEVESLRRVVVNAAETGKALVVWRSEGL